ncbi:MAG: hypothetical protein C5B51_03415 [Terriglobia bacterium]|nr:MAG: hypothetical protein C5B51_03415 [Terriglobia bacterium]
MNWIAMVVLITLAIGVGMCWLVSRLANPKASLPVTAGWIEALSIERYRPMMRLLDAEDLEFLRSQPGFTPRMAARLRVQRCQIFRGYLRCLSGDFAKVCMAIKILLLQSRDDRPDLAAALLRQQVLFAGGMLAVQFRLFLYRWGFCGADVTGLVKIFDIMRLELQSMVPVTLGMEA